MMRHDTGDLVAYVVHGCWDGAALTRAVRVRNSTAHHARRSHTTTTVHAHAKSLEKDSCAIQSRGKESPVNTCHNITPLASGIRFRKGGEGVQGGGGQFKFLPRVEPRAKHPTRTSLLHNSEKNKTPKPQRGNHTPTCQEVTFGMPSCNKSKSSCPMICLDLVWISEIEQVHVCE